MPLDDPDNLIIDFFRACQQEPFALLNKRLDELKLNAEHLANDQSGRLRSIKGAAAALADRMEKIEESRAEDFGRLSRAIEHIKNVQEAQVLQMSEAATSVTWETFTASTEER